MTATPVEQRPVRGRWGLWVERDFRRLWIGETASGLGTAVGEVSLVLVAVGVLRAGSFMVGVLTASAWLPWLFLGLSAGAWVDRWSRRTVMLVGDLLLLALFASVPVAEWTGVLTVWQLVAVAFLAGAVKVFFTTAYRTLLPALVAEPDVLEANVKLQSSAAAMDVAGPGVAGVVAEAFGAVTGLLIDACSYLLSALCLSAIDAREERPARAERRGIRQEVAEGVRFVVHDPYLRTVSYFAGLGNLGLSGLQAVQTVLLVRSVGLRPGGVGAVFAVVSVGGLVGAAIAGRIAARFGTARGLLLCELIGAPFLLLLPFAGRWLPLPVCVAAWAVAVGGVVAGNVITGSFFQSYCPPELLGRINSCSSSIGYGAMPVGALLGGFLGGEFGSRAAAWVMASVVVSAGWVILASPIRGRRDLPRRTDGVIV
ncbi:MFS transporter [Streptacidiphilus sp. P02-A3a]|uniref:MFS transporter n=1 Tax=Streptacidiphilus sp. P02-A3a TaxID=2704468 RepID=UPI0015FBE53E|nr:MFS transporter [Streptacidiphilus sp. P02-A3a]QMU68300.1 MFS transporter [Streptacidiphilus sp. P02-A3a]